MLQGNEIRDRKKASEAGTVMSDTEDALNIEEVLRRAREIHRQHGGIFGYDFEDWAQAWSVRPKVVGNRKFERAEEVERAVATDAMEEVRESCFGYDN